MKKAKFCYRCGKEQIFTDKLDNGKTVSLHCSHCGVNDWRNEEEKIKQQKYIEKIMTQRWAW